MWYNREKIFFARLKKMKIGVSSYSFSKHLAATQCGYIEMCNKAKEMGFDGIEFIGLVNEKWGITGDPIAIAKEVRAHCEKIGLEIIAYTIGANFLAPNPEETVKKLYECVDICEALGAKVMRHDVASNPGEYRPEPLYNYRKAIAEIAPYITAIPHPFAAVACAKYYSSRVPVATITDDEFKACFAAAAEKGIAMEINPNFFRNQTKEQIDADQFTRMFRIARDMGCLFTVGLDSHSTGGYAAFDAIYNAIDVLELNENHLHPLAR
jgi:sugar phosphate isomerase/epimerase